MTRPPPLLLSQKSIKWGVAVCALLWLPSAFADLNDVMNQFKTAGAAINGQLVGPAIKTAAAALLLQWILTYAKEIFSGDISSTLAKSVFLLSWFGGALLLIKNVDVMSTMFTGYVALAGGLSGLSAGEFSPGGMIDAAILSIKTVHQAVDNAGGGGGMLAVSQNVAAAVSLVVVDVILLVCYFLLALTLFVVTLEFWMLFAVAPLAFGMIPLQAFRDQGMAPVKGVIALGLRVIILGVVVATAKAFSASAAVDIPAALQNTSSGSDLPLLAALGGYLAGVMGCAMMAVYSGKLAATIANGSASFSGSDAIKTGMQIASAATVAGGVAAAVAAPAIGGIKSAASSAAAAFSGGPKATPSSNAGAFGAPLRQAPSSVGSGSDGGAPSSGAHKPNADMQSQIKDDAKRVDDAQSQGRDPIAAADKRARGGSTGGSAGDSPAGTGTAGGGTASIGGTGNDAWGSGRSVMDRLGTNTLGADDNTPVQIQLNTRGSD